MVTDLIMKKSLIFLIPLLLIAGCQSKNTFTINGTVKESKNKTILLKRVNVNTLMLIDSSKVRSNGKFKFKIKATYPDFYQLGFSNTDFVTILAEPGEKIKLVFNGTDLSQNFTVSGSGGSEKVRMLDMRLARVRVKLDSLRTLYEAASKEPDFDTKGPLLENEYMSVLKDIRKKNIEFIINNLKSMASIKAIYQRIDENAYVLYDPRDLQYLKIVSDSLGRYYPNSTNVQALAEDVKRELGQLYSRQVQDLASSSPEIHLDPNLKDLNGKRTALSSLKGKIVLLSFWSVESKDCIAENLQLKDFYKTYHKKGFEIYQINVDTSEVKWRTEVKFDELPWINAREDDPLNPKNARLYNVRALPANYLYDRDGNIIGSNLHGKSLQIRLNQLFNN
jgi:thiol-disulfide isomerase/thioredoxin